MRIAHANWLVLSAAVALVTGAAAEPSPGPGSQSAPRPVIVASKVFTESVVLGEILTATLRAAGVPAAHRRELGGTRVVWNALERGDVDAYVEYTGTLLKEVLAADADVDASADPQALANLLAKRGVGIAARLGFNNTYVLGMRTDKARSLNIRRLSDLREHRDLRYGLSNEFLSRADGWPGLQSAYGLTSAPSRGLQHELAYRAIEAGDVDVIDLYSTDAQIAQYNLVALEDDRALVPALRRGDRVSAATCVPTPWRRWQASMACSMRRAWRRSMPRYSSVTARKARLRRSFSPCDRVASRHDGRWTRLLDRTVEHLVLVGISLGAAILVAVPLGIIGFLRPKVGEFLLALTGIVQTIPALALLVFMIPWFGIGAWPAIAALFLYSLLPIVRNTHLGLKGVPADVRESAVVLGLPVLARLRLVELPLAKPSILAGIRTAAVINIGTATLGALIGAGGYGEPILTGIRLDDTGLILEGAVPAALLALIVQSLRPLRRRS